LTCFCDFPQNEHFSRSPPSPIRATYVLPALIGRRVPAVGLRTISLVAQILGLAQLIVCGPA
jgi:hypothetical protein